MKVLGGGGNDAWHISAPSNTAPNKFVDFEFLNNSRDEDFGSNSKSRSNFAIEPMV